MQCLFVSTSLRVSITDLDVSLSTHVTNAAGTCQDKALPVLHHTGRGQTCTKEVLAQDKEDPEMDIDSDANIQLTEADLHVFEEVQKKP